MENMDRWIQPVKSSKTEKSEPKTRKLSSGKKFEKKLTKSEKKDSVNSSSSESKN